VVISQTEGFLKTSTPHRDTGYEKRLVEEICTPAGVRVAPPKDALEKFVTRCRSLDCHKVAEGLQHQLDTAEDEKRIRRTLYVIEALAKSDIVGIDRCLIDLQEVLQELTTEDDDKIATKAKQALNAVLGVASEKGGTSAEGSEAATSRSTSTVAMSVNLLTLDEVG